MITKITVEKINEILAAKEIRYWPNFRNHVGKYFSAGNKMKDCSFFLGSPRKIVTMGVLKNPWTEAYSSLFQSFNFSKGEEEGIWLDQGGRLNVCEPQIGFFVRWENNAPKTVLLFEIIKPSEKEMRDARNRIFDKTMRRLIKNLQDCCQ